MKITIYQVDAFTDKLFGGNPAAICPLEEWLPSATMQAIAEENNLSETAFFVREGDAFELRWFTPKIEILLAGHPTLAAAHVIYQHLKYTGPQISFLTKSGELRVKKRNGLILMDFPGFDPAPSEPPEALVKAWGKSPGKRSKDGTILRSSAARRRSWPSGRTSPSSKNSIAWVSSSPPRATPAISSPGSSPREPGFSRTRSRVRPTRSLSPSGPSA